MAIALGATLAIVLCKYPTLPASIPTHFDLNGVPNGYSSRSSLFVLFGISLAFYLSMLFFQKKPHLMNTPIPTDKNGNPKNLTKGQWQRFTSINVVFVSVVLSILITIIIYGLLGICQVYELSPYFPIIQIVAIGLALAFYFYRIKHLSFAEDDYIRTKIETSHSQFLAMADNQILEQLRIINGSEFLPENKRMQLINDIRSTHTEVTDYIRKAAPALSEDDITYCLLSSLGLNNTSISACMASSEDALRKRKSRIRKKLPETLAAYLLDDGKGI